MNNAYISISNRYQKINESNTEDYVKPTQAAESNKTNSGERNNSNTRKKSTASKEAWQRHCHFGRFNGQRLKGMGTLK